MGLRTLSPPDGGGCADVATTAGRQVPEIGSADQARVEAERLPENAIGEGTLANDRPVRQLPAGGCLEDDRP